MTDTRKLLLIFILAFITNLAWENLHAGLYYLPGGEAITQYMLLRSTFGDAIIITIFGAIFLHVGYLKRRKWLLLIVGVVLAILIEIVSLKTGRWAYNDLMPIVPLIGTGLTPTIQLGVLSYMIIRLVDEHTESRIA